MKKLLWLLAGALISVSASAQVATRTSPGVVKLGNNMVDSAGAIRILFPPSAPASTSAVRDAVNGSPSWAWSKSEGIGSVQIDWLNAMIDNRLKSYDGWDASVTKVLSTTGTSFKWILPTSTSGSSGTSTAQVSPRDTAFFYADTTQGRVTRALMTTDTLRTEAQVRNALTTVQTNKRFVVVDGLFNLATALGQTANWTNVLFEPKTPLGTTFRCDNNSIVFIFTTTHTINQVEIGAFKFVSHNTGSQYAVFYSNELVGGDGLKLAGIDVTNDGFGSFNGIGMAQYSTGSNTGATIKHVWLSRVHTHQVSRANEFLSQGYDYPRILGIAITNSLFEDMGLSDQHGFGSSFSGLIKGVFVYKNTYLNCRNICLELVNVQYALAMNNTMTVNTANIVTAVGISDDGVGTTRYHYIENNTANVTGRSFYCYGAKYLFFDGGNYIGRYGVDMTCTNSSFKNLSVTTWDNVSSGGSGTSFAWQVDVAASNNLFDNINVSSSNTIANGGLYAREVMVIKGTNNTVRNSIFTQGKQQNGSYYGFILVNSGGVTNSISENNQQLNGL